MQQEIKRDVLSILGEAIAALKKGSFADLKIISNHTIHNASIFQDRDSVSVAVIVYSLFKTSTRFSGDRNIILKLQTILQKAHDCLREDDIESYRGEINHLFEVISDIDDRLKMYIEEVVNHAEIRKGFKLYEHGISMARAAEILGVTQWELMGYAGKTTIDDIEKQPVGIIKRVRFAKELFGV